MSISPHASSPSHGDHDHGGHHESGQSHSTMRGYLTGFGLSVVLTAIPFWLVMARPIEDVVLTASLVVLLAVAQIFVHMIYFLHMDAKSEGGWTVMALIFTLVIVVITISGSLWVMYHLNSNMMAMDGGMPTEGMQMDGGQMDHGQMNQGLSMDGKSDAQTGGNAPAAAPGNDGGMAPMTMDSMGGHDMDAHDTGAGATGSQSGTDAGSGAGAGAHAHGGESGTTPGDIDGNDTQQQGFAVTPQ